YTTDEVPYITYIRYYTNQWNGVSEEKCTAIGEGSRGQDRPIWALPYYHYKNAEGIKDEQIKYLDIAVETRGIEGGGGNYGENSGGFDALGFGTLMYTR